MGLNKKFVKMKKDKRAEMGVGTMIIFIAMVLVAAVAASVLISTANQVREQAQATGNDAINNVATGFVYQDVIGTVDDITSASAQINKLDINIRLAAGSPDIDMSNVIVSVTDGAHIYDLKLGTADAIGVYTATAVRDSSATPFATTKYVHQGDMIKVTIGDLSPLGLDPSTHVTVKIMPAYGQASEIVFTTPETYSSTAITLK